MEKWGWGDAGSARRSLPLGRSCTTRRDSKQGASGGRTDVLVARYLGQASKQAKWDCGRGDGLKKARAGGAGRFGRAKGGWAEVLLTWEEGRQARAEVQHLVAVHEAEIVPIVPRLERLHYQPVELAVFHCLEACGRLLAPLEGGPGQGGDKDDEVKGPILVLADPECAAVILSGQTFQLQPLSHLGVCDAAVTKPDRHTVALAVDPRTACGREILVGTAWEEPCPPGQASLPVHGVRGQMQREGQMA